MKYPIKMQQTYRKKTIDILVFCNDSCNYNCYYCYNKLPRTNKYVNLDNVTQFLERLHKQTQREIFVELIGGEPTLHPQLVSFCIAVSAMPYTTCGIYTNFSSDIKMYRQLLDLGINLTITYHGNIDYAQFFDKLQMIDDKYYDKQLIDIRVMLENIRFRKCIDAFKLIATKYQKHTEICLLDNDKNKIYHIHDKEIDNFYTDEQIAEYNQLLKDNDIEHVLYEVTYNDNTVELISVNKANDNDIYNEFKYWLCNVGKDFFYIDCNGNVFPCQAFLDKLPIMNINTKYDIIPIKPHLCIADRCHCLWEVYKEKIFNKQSKN